ncbi:MAG: TraR/DksA C4-type zinc finger protein [Nitrospira sp.]|nr:TraR/DksA C4-type zinc finger protein [Nitrospira sp.]
MTESDAWTDPQRDELRRVLEGQRLELEQRRFMLKTEAQPVGLELPIGRLSRMDAMQQQQMAAGQQRRLDLEFQQVLAAIERLDRQRYGFCLRCQEPIPYARLLVRPTTPLCYGCQDDVESRKQS